MNLTIVHIRDSENIIKAIRWCFKNIEYVNFENTDVWLKYNHKFGVMDLCDINDDYLSFEYSVIECSYYHTYFK